MNERVKAINPQIVVHGTLDKPYYEISYWDTNDNQWHIGYSSYDLQTVKGYLDNYFEIIEADVEPVKHGEWAGTVCCCCGESTVNYYDCDYCPNCGAKMDGKEVTERQKLIELLKSSKLCSKRFDDQYSDGTIAIIANHLLENGVILVDTNSVKRENLPLIQQAFGMPLDELAEVVKEGLQNNK